MGGRKQRKELIREKLRAQSDIIDIRSSLGEAYARFDKMADPDVMDACIFEISALRAHYNNAVRRAKNLYL